MARQDRLLRTLRIHIPEPLYLASAGPAQPRRVLLYPAPPAPGGRSARTAAAQGRAPGRRRRTLELPPLRRYPDREQTVLQPQYPAELLPSKSLHLPELFFWAPQTAPSAVIKPFVTPGHAVRPAEPARLEAPPRLEMPLPDLGRVPTAGTPGRDAAASLAPPLALPLRTAPGAGSPGSNSADALPGDPSAVLSLASDPLPLREYLTVPPGNQLGLAPDTAAAHAGAGGARGHGETGAGANGPAAAVVRPSPAGALPEAALPAAAPAHPAADAGAPPRPSGHEAARPKPSAAIEATRVVHPPNGVFDIVVQSSGVDGFPESAGVLSGKPVYSVYLKTGAVKDWILQYCLPAGEVPPAEVSGGVIRLGSPGPLSAPFPRITLRPLIYRRPGTYLMLHGFVDVNGRFQNLKVLGVNDPQESAQVVAVLEQWEFRPAAQDGHAVRVEVLLAIPTE